MPSCRSCGASIRWVKLRPELRNHPVDATPHKTIVLAPLAVDEPPHGKIVDGYVSHFSTCPQADDWRDRDIPDDQGRLEV